MMSGLPASDGSSSTATEAKKASMSTCRMPVPVSSAPGGETMRPVPSPRPMAPILPRASDIAAGGGRRRAQPQRSAQPPPEPAEADCSTANH